MSEQMVDYASFEQGELVEVQWVDAAGDGGWFKEHEVAQRPLVSDSSVGYFVRHDDDVVVIAQSRGTHDADELSWGCPLYIPKGLVRAMVRYVHHGLADDATRFGTAARTWRHECDNCGFEHTAEQQAHEGECGPDACAYCEWIGKAKS